MDAVWKFSFEIQDFITIEMPVGAEILHVGSQGDKGCIWARVTTGHKKESRQFRLTGTGHPLDRNHDIEHVGTFETRGGTFVWYLFEFPGGWKQAEKGDS